MLNLSRTLRVFVCTQPADMRRSFDGLCGMAENLMQQDPLAGHLFVFRNRNRDGLKILYWDRDGFRPKVSVVSAHNPSPGYFVVGLGRASRNVSFQLGRRNEHEKLRLF
jgi:transposase